MNPKPEKYKNAFCAAYWENYILQIQTTENGGIELKIGELGEGDIQEIEITLETAQRLIVSLSDSIEFIKEKENETNEN